MDGIENHEFLDSVELVNGYNYELINEWMKTELNVKRKE